MSLLVTLLRTGLAAGLLLTVVACTVTNAAEPSAGRSASGTAVGGVPPPASPGAAASGGGGSALKLLATIPVKGRAPETGYSRGQFGPAWTDTDRNGCDQRNDILRRDLTNETLKPRTNGCVVLSGTLVDRYTGATVAFRKSSASAVQIDHVVALQNAWVTGAYRWTAAKRTQLATDPLNLLAVGGSVNESKGSGDAATWLPRKPYRCEYVARQVAVKAKYGAWMTPAEHRAIAGILAACPGQKLPVVQVIPLGQGATSGAGARPSGAAGGSSAASGSVVSAGAFCSPKGATGRSAAGTRLVCSSKNGDRDRWRSP